MTTGISNGFGARRLAAALAVGSMLVLSAGSRLAADADHSDHRLEGTWRVEVTTEDCTSGAPVLTFRALLSFAKGGTLSGTTASPAFRPGQRTSDYGVWRQTGGDTYRAVSEAFTLFDSPAAPPVPGFVRGVQRLTQAIEVEGDTFASDAAVRFFNANGDLLVTGCATAAGRRMK
jgi:hypothetical protein